MANIAKEIAIIIVTCEIRRCLFELKTQLTEVWWLSRASMSMMEGWRGGVEDKEKTSVS